VTVLGVCFAVFLMIFQGSLWPASWRAAFASHDASDSDIWITARGVQAFEFGTTLESPRSGNGCRVLAGRCGNQSSLHWRSLSTALPAERSKSSLWSARILMSASVSPSRTWLHQLETHRLRPCSTM